MARMPLARRIARLTPFAAAGMAAAALAAPAAAQSSYPTGDGLVAVSAGGSTATVWPDGTNLSPNLVGATVGTFDGSGLTLSTHKGSIVSLFSMTSGSVISNQPAGTTVSASAATPDGYSLLSVAGGKLKTLTGPFTWGDLDPAVGRFGQATLPGSQRIVYVAGPGAVNGGGQDISGSVVVREPNGSRWVATSDPGAKNATVSPDGRWLAYEKDDLDQRNVWLFDLNSDGAPFLAADQGGADEYLPTFSPDSTRLLFAKSYSGQTEIREIPVSAIGTSEAVTSLDVESVDNIAWQPAVKPTAGTVSVDTVTVPKTGTSVASTGNPNAGYKPHVETYTWQRCVDAPQRQSDDCADIADAHGTSYTPVAADVGYRLRVVREVKAPAGSDTKHSGMTPVVVADDTTPPLAPTITTKPDAHVDYRFPRFAWTGAEAGGTFECRVRTTPLGRDSDGYDTGWIACASPNWTIPGLDGLEDGPYTFYVRQIDDALNAGEIARHEFTVDTLEPVKPEWTFEMYQHTTTSTSATWTFANPSSEVTTFECRLDGEDPRIPVGPQFEPCTSPHTVSDLAVGTHRLEVRQVDRAGNRSDAISVKWTVIEKPTPAPVVETPKPAAPVVEAPKAEVPAAPRAVEAPKPVVKPAPAKAPALVATIGGTKSGAQVGATGGTSSAAIIEVAKESVGVGCSITGTVLKSCKVDLFAPTAGAASARAAANRLVLVGTGTYEAKNGSSKMDVKIELNATGKALLRKNPAGLNVTVKIKGTPVSGKALSVTGKAKLVTDRASLTVGGFAVDSAKLTTSAKRRLAQLAKFGKAGTVTCVGHTDGSSDDAKYLKTLGAERARAVCAYLAKQGVKGTAKTVSRGASLPVATNTTKAGRAQNRRVQVTLVR